MPQLETSSYKPSLRSQAPCQLRVQLLQGLFADNSCVRLLYVARQNGVLKVAPNGIVRDTMGIVELRYAASVGYRQFFGIGCKPCYLRFRGANM